MWGVGSSDNLRAATIGLFLLAWASPAEAEIKYIGVAALAGDTSDGSGLHDRLADGIPHNRLGGVSAIEYTGTGNRYLVLSDRGPGDGTTDYFCRFHVVELSVDPRQTPAATVTLQSTSLLRDREGKRLTGAKAAFPADTRPTDAGVGPRFDPEGLRRTKLGQLVVADEYGPSLCEFAPDGSLQRLFAVPSRFLVDRPASDPDDENRLNSRGRQANGGFEGLAITPDGSRLYAVMQRSLIQDSRAGARRKRVGINVRLVEFTIEPESTREFLYVLDDAAHGISEILAVNAHEFLVLERDGRGGDQAHCKKIFHVDIAGATDISGIESLPPLETPSMVKPVKKALFLDLLDRKLGLTGPAFPEKQEGLAFGPDLADGRRLLIVATDNDFRADAPILFHAFAIDRDSLSDFGW